LIVENLSANIKPNSTVKLPKMPSGDAPVVFMKLDKIAGESLLLIQQSDMKGNYSPLNVLSVNSLSEGNVKYVFKLESPSY
jgi:hypothetical protein